MSEANKALVRRSWEVLDNPDLIEEVYAADSILHEPDQDLRGLGEIRQFIAMYKTAFPDLNATVDDVIAEGDHAVTRWTVRGTHQGDIEEFGPSTGRRVELEGITMHRIEGGKVAEEWERYDNLSLLQQLGLAPAPQQAEA